MALASFTVGTLAGGRAADRFGARPPAAAAALGAGAGLALAGAGDGLWALTASYGGLFGCASGAAYACAVRVAATMDSRRGLALTLVVSAYALAAVAIAPVAAVALGSFGPAPVLVALGAATAVLLGLGAALVPAGPRRGRAPAGPLPRRKLGALWVIFGLGSAPALAAFSQAGAAAGLASAAAVALLSAGNLLGRLVAGPAADRFGRAPALRACSAGLAACCALLGAERGGPVAGVAALGLGAQYGALSVLVPAATADACGPRRYGSAYGWVFTAWGVAGLVAPPAAGALAGTAGWGAVFGLGAAGSVVCWALVGPSGAGSRSDPR